MITRKAKKILRILRQPNFVLALAKGVAAGTEHINVFKDFDFTCVIDIGANRGQFALIARKLFPDAFIYSFEPLEEPAKVFEDVFRDDPKVKLSRCAIGCENSDAIIHVSERDDSSSLLPISKIQSDLFPNTGECETRTAKLSTLAKAIDIDNIGLDALLKIDVQGYELQVLKGCLDDIGKFKCIYVECSFIELYEGQAFADEVIKLLQKNGFSLIGVYNVFYDAHGKSIQADFLFHRK